MVLKEPWAQCALVLRYCLTYPYLNLRDFQPAQARFNFDAAAPRLEGCWKDGPPEGVPVFVTLWLCQPFAKFCAIEIVDLPIKNGDLPI